MHGLGGSIRTASVPCIGSLWPARDLGVRAGTTAAPSGSVWAGWVCAGRAGAGVLGPGQSYARGNGDTVTAS